MKQIIVRMIGRNPDNPKSRKVGLPTVQMLEPNADGLCNCLTSVQKDNLVLEIYNEQKNRKTVRN